MLSSFFLSHILCILLPAYLCYALQPLYNYIFLVRLCSLCKYSFYTDVCLYLSAFPDSQLFFVTVAPFPSGRCRRKSMLTGCCDTMPAVQAYLFLYFLCQPIQQSGYHLIHPRLFQLCFKLITGSCKFMLIILTLFTFFHICKILFFVFLYAICKQDTFLYTILL